MHQDLARRAREGDHDAFSALVRETLGRLYTTARLILGDPDRAQEAVQDALIEAWRDIRGLRDLDRLDAWLHRLLVRSCYRVAKRERRRSVTEIPLMPFHDDTAPDGFPPLADRDEIERAFQRLTQDQRTVLTLVYFADLSLVDTAAALGIPVGTTKSRLHHSLAALRAALAADQRFLVGSQLQGDDPPPSPMPSPLASPLASPLGVVIDPAVELQRLIAPSADERVTSRLFRPKVTFTATPRTQGETAGDVCPRAHTSARTIVLAHPKGCVQDLRFIRPWAVDCGAAGDHPDAAGLAAAILAIPGTRPSADLGDISSGGDLPKDLFREPYPGRVVRMAASGPSVAWDVSDPDQCTLLPEPGTDDPVIEIRHDIGALFVLLDLDGELVVIRASADGHDSGSHQGAVARGYAGVDDDQLIHLLHLVRDIRFGP